MSVFRFQTYRPELSGRFGLWRRGNSYGGLRWICPSGACNIRQGEVFLYGEPLLRIHWNRFIPQIFWFEILCIVPLTFGALVDSITLDYNIQYRRKRDNDS